jgi:HrpA-like RNA helicase
VRPGTCWRLYHSALLQYTLPEYTLPEMLRTPLEELVLQTLILELGDPQAVLSRAVEPPPEAMLVSHLRPHMHTFATC